jgi:hypothetical protein
VISDVQKAKTLIEIDADTSGARREIKKLGDVEKQNADAREKHTSAWKLSFTELNSAHQLVTKGVKVFNDLMKESAEHAKLVTATYGIQIEKLRQSSLGLVSNMELMRRAASLTAGEFKKTTEELAAAEGAIRALTLRGVEQKKAQEAIHKLMNEFNAGPLKDLGFGLDLAAMKTDTAAARIAAYGDAMKVVNSLADESAKKGLQTGEAWAQGATTAQDAWDKFKRSLVAEWNR